MIRNGSNVNLTIAFMIQFKGTSCSNDVFIIIIFIDDEITFMYSLNARCAGVK